MKPTCARSEVKSILNPAAWKVFLGSICVSLSFPLLAEDCSSDDITLTSQAQVNSFKAVYGSCDFVVGNLIIKENAFSNLAGLNGLTGVGGNLGIQDISALTSLSDLSGLTSVGGLYLRGTDSLANLTGLNNLSGSIGRIEISRMDQLSDLTGLPASLDSVGGLLIENNDELQSLTNLPAIATLGSLAISENILLADIEALSASSFNVSFDLFPPLGAPSIIVNGNPLLGSLTGIPPVTTLRGLHISSNPLISSLDPLSGALEVWGGEFVVTNNSNLSDCSALTKIVDEHDDGFPGPNDQNNGLPPDFLESNFQMYDNASGCNSIEEILDNVVDTGGVFDDGFEEPES